MKFAVDNSGRTIAAAEGSPTHGLCPQCGAPVILRRRGDGKGGKTYFWRHQDHLNLDCPARFSAGGRRRTDASGVQEWAGASGDGMP